MCICVYVCMCMDTLRRVCDTEGVQTCPLVQEKLV